MEHNELKPCPFCGGEAVIKDTKFWMSDAVYVHCAECGASVQKKLANHTFYKDGKEMFMTKEQAVQRVVNAWNRRANDE